MGVQLFVSSTKKRTMTLAANSTYTEGDDTMKALYKTWQVA